MPSRSVSLAILAFWLLAAGWFVVRDVRPFNRSGEPPPYVIALADEALPNNVPFRWTCTLHGKKIGTVSTALVYKASDDAFELQARSPKLTFLELPLSGNGRITISANDYDDRVRVTRSGELRMMRTLVNLVIEGVTPAISARLILSAAVRNGRLERQFRLESPQIGQFEPVLESVDPPHGSMLNPMHPVVRITGLRPGQNWRQPLIDPRTDILRAALSQWLPGKAAPLPDPPRELAARVLPEADLLEWPGESHWCFVIEYRDGEDYIARTWVRKTDGAVLRQEAGAHGETLVLQRE
jgi:hypothetical protein